MIISKKEIEETQIGILTDFNQGSNLLVSFGGISQGLGIPVFEFFNSISDLDCDKVFIRDFQQAWYQKGVDDQVNSFSKVLDLLRQIIAENKYERICFLGNSMGGYAAILFGTILNVDKVISFAPQTFIDKWRRLYYRDTRWKKQLSRVHSYENKRKEYFNLKAHLINTIDFKTSIDIYYSPNDRLDKIHAERLGIIPQIKLIPINEGGHGVVKTVRNNGDLRKVIEAAFHSPNRVHRKVAF